MYKTMHVICNLDYDTASSANKTFKYVVIKSGTATHTERVKRSFFPHLSPEAIN